MSVLFGTMEHNRQPSRNDIERLAAATTRYGPHGTYLYPCACAYIGFQAFDTGAARKGLQRPFRDTSGNVCALDGRLDNTDELRDLLEVRDAAVTDEELILTAFKKWRTEAFSRLVGEWACSIWDAADRSIFLARDHAGTRTLYFGSSEGRWSWGTYLETFVPGSGALTVDREYIRHQLTATDIEYRTPFARINEVPPAHVVRICSDRATFHRHWTSGTLGELTYKHDSDYDEHFLHLFGRAVARRLVGADTIVAELSGGVDSSSIVCMADRYSAPAAAKLPTLSYYDNTEPDWDELPYIMEMETGRQHRGIHIDASSPPAFRPLATTDWLYPYPGADTSSIGRSERLHSSVTTAGFTTILSGVGGDELLGGVPTPLPELAEHLVCGRLATLVRRSLAWSLAQRRPLMYLLGDTVSFVRQLYFPTQATRRLPPWLVGDRESHGDQPDLETWDNKLSYGPRRLSNLRVWRQLLSSLPNRTPPLVGCYEIRFPYLDRDLVSFLHRVPRHQLVGPGRRRLMMRRALRGIVPEMILERRRKAHLSRAPIGNLRVGASDIEHLFAGSFLARDGFIQDDIFVKELHSAVAGSPEWVPHIYRTIMLELWIRSMGHKIAA